MEMGFIIVREGKRKMNFLISRSKNIQKYIGHRLCSINNKHDDDNDDDSGGGDE